MKMRKLLATGVAATLAVTSLATTASAAELAFPMGNTEGTVKQENQLAFQVLDIEYLNDDAGLKGLSGKLAIKDTKDDATTVTAAKLVVTGKQDKEDETKEYSYAFNDDGTIEFVTGAVVKNGQVNLGAFTKVESVKVYITRSTTYDNAADYDADWGFWSPVLDYGTAIEFTNVVGASLQELADDFKANSDNGGVVNHYTDTNKTTATKYPFIPVTDGANQNKVDGILTRQEILQLSEAGAHTAYTAEMIVESWGIALGHNPDFNQSYLDNGLGDTPRIFGGFASQVADFFNKQTNGTITFKFTTPSASSSTAWENGGIPSTQVGIKNFLGDATANDFALFFNYAQTGSLQAVTSIDANAGTVTFTIDDVLDAIGGQTIGVIDNMYYGLVKGATNFKLDDGTDTGIAGLYVESVTLAYAEDEAADDDIVEDDADDAEDDADDVVEDDADDADDDVDLDDDADDVIEDDADDAEDDADVDGEVVTTPDTDDDANPPTGVALAVVPAMIAAAAVVVSKKRK